MALHSSRTRPSKLRVVVGPNFKPKPRKFLSAVSVRLLTQMVVGVGLDADVGAALQQVGGEAVPAMSPAT
jgi:hypothetical protein